MTTGERAALRILAERGQPMFGLDMVKASGGALSRGTVYVHLHRLEEAGLVTSWPEPDASALPDTPRRLYQVTLTGARHAATLSP